MSSSRRRDSYVLSLAPAQQEASRGWFEDDEAFEARVAASQAAFAAKAKTKSSKKSSSGGTGYKAVTTSSANKWVLPGAQNKMGAWGSKTTTTKKKTSARGGNVFAAMMDDSDSD